MSDDEAKRVVRDWARSMTPAKREAFARGVAKGAGELFSCFKRNDNGTWRLDVEKLEAIKAKATREREALEK